MGKTRSGAAGPRPDPRRYEVQDDLYRVRVGDYRVLYVIDDEALIVLVVNVGNRRDIYRGG